MIGGALLLGEDVTSSLLLGAPLVLVGVYIGALSGSQDRTISAEPASTVHRVAIVRRSRTGPRRGPSSDLG